MKSNMLVPYSIHNWCPVFHSELNRMPSLTSRERQYYLGLISVMASPRIVSFPILGGNVDTRVSAALIRGGNVDIHVGAALISGKT